MPVPPDPNRTFAEGVVRRLRAAGHQALFAGGCVRDLLLGRTPKDYDVATDARPEQVRELFGHNRTLAVGASFGVIVVVPSKRERAEGTEPVEVATFRTEGPYVDGRRPSGVAFASPEEDAKRRDFTVNGMFLDPIENRVFDFVGGEADLAAGVVRAIGDPRERMAEDKLRLLRAVRFAGTFGFRLDEPTAAAVREMAGQLTVVSAERIAQELRRMLVGNNRHLAMRLCADLGLLEVIVPELSPALRSGDAVPDLPGRRTAWQRTLLMLGALTRPSFELALAVLLHALPSALADEGKRRPDPVGEICRRLRLSNVETERIVWLVEHRSDLDGIRDAPPSRLKRLCAHPGVHELIALAWAEAVVEAADLSDVAHIQSFLRTTPPEQIDPPPLLTGDDLIGLGLRPGPGFKRLLDAVRDAQLDGGVTTADEASAMAARLHAAGAADTNGPR